MTQLHLAIDDFTTDDCPCCPHCERHGTLIGVLGNLTWFRCRACGWDFSTDEQSR